LRPDISLRLATELTPLWQATEDILAAHNLPPPFWAFAWPGAEALAAHIAAAIAGAASVEAAEIDPFAAAAITLNAADNFQVIEVSLGDIVGAACRWDVILCGDVCYEAPMTRHIMPWLHACAAAGATTIIADPARKYAPRTGHDRIARYNVPVIRELEDSDNRTVDLLRLH
jgi:predicted nicotinamide N-methyase